MKKLLSALVFALLLSASAFAVEPAESQTPFLKGNTLFTAIHEIVARPEAFVGRIVSIKARFNGWQGGIGAPPVTRSDWVATGENGDSLYCVGAPPEGLMPGDRGSLGKAITVLGQVELDSHKRPYITVSETTIFAQIIEPMVSVSSILFDPLNLRGQRVRLLGVLAKGADSRGRRLYLLADPSGAITLDRLPRLYPKGTILQITGVVGNDENGLPQLTDVEIVSARL